MSEVKDIKDSPSKGKIQSLKNSGIINKSMNQSKSFAMANQSVLLCSLPGHQQEKISHICLLENWDLPTRLLSKQCMNVLSKKYGEKCFFQIQDLISSNEVSPLSLKLENYPVDEYGMALKKFIYEEYQTVESLSNYITDQLDDLKKKINKQLESIKEKMIQEVETFYKRGQGKTLISNLEVLKREFTSGWNLEEIQGCLKSLLNREITTDVFEQQINFFLKNSTTQKQKQKAVQFYTKNFSNYESPKPKFPKEQFQEITVQILDCLKKYQICLQTETNNKNLSTKEYFQKIPSPTVNSAPQQQCDFLHQVQNYINEKVSIYSEKQLVEYGTENYADGSKYQGFFLNGLRHLLGTRYYSDGNIYTGEWNQGKRQGKGILYYFKGNVKAYEGLWLDDQKHGQGIELYLNNGKFEGTFSCDKKHGEGKYYYPDGRIFAGNYINDKREGEGTIFFKSGLPEKVYFQQGVKIQQNSNQDQKQ